MEPFAMTIGMAASVAGAGWLVQRRTLADTLDQLDDVERRLLLGDAERRALWLIARGATGSAALNPLAFALEALFEGRHCTILLVDESGKTLTVGGTGSTPRELAGALDCLPLQPGVSACVEAVRSNAVVIVEDAGSDPRCDGVRDLLRPLGLRGYWSAPIADTRGSVVGTLAVFSGRRAAPGETEAATLGAAAAVTGRVLERLAAETRARQALERAALAEKTGAFGLWDGDVARTTH